jgi:hypothetical protein
VDPNHDANMFSFYYRSRLDIGLAKGGRFKCEDMRPGCPGMTSSDGVSGTYDWFKIATSPDHPGATPSQCAKAGRVVPLHYRGRRVVRAAVYINGKRVKVYRGLSLKRITIPNAAGRHTVKIVLRFNRGRPHTSVRTYNGCKKTKPRRVRR